MQPFCVTNNANQFEKVSYCIYLFCFGILCCLFLLNWRLSLHFFFSFDFFDNFRWGWFVKIARCSESGRHWNELVYTSSQRHICSWPKNASFLRFSPNWEPDKIVAISAQFLTQKEHQQWCFFWCHFFIRQWFWLQNFTRNRLFTMLWISIWERFGVGSFAYYKIENFD